MVNNLKTFAKKEHGCFCQFISTLFIILCDNGVYDRDVYFVSIYYASLKIAGSRQKVSDFEKHLCAPIGWKNTLLTKNQ